MERRVTHIFPLQLVLLEDEEIRLHIFEPRYKKLIRDCAENKSTFGMPAVIANTISGFGADLSLMRIDQVYEGGEMDIVCKVESRFEILEIYQSEDANIAATALVKGLPYFRDEDKELDLRLFDLFTEFYHVTETTPPHGFSKEMQMLSLVHKCGLQLTQEEELAALQSARERQLYLINHLKQMVVVLGEVKRMKDVVKLNGHFKKLPQSF